MEKEDPNKMIPKVTLKARAPTSKKKKKKKRKKKVSLTT
jgi:hypothetical protein